MKFQGRPLSGYAAEFKLKVGRAEALALVRVSLFLVKDLRLCSERERGETV